MQETKKKAGQEQKTKISRIIVFIFIGLFLMVFFKTLQRPARTVPQPAPVQETPQVERINISGVSVKDFMQDHDPQELFITLSKTKDYHVFYIPSQEVFFISIVSYPFDEYRPIAEEDLLYRLEITKEEACRLSVNITTPAFANPEKSGRTYGLSFCGQVN
jgi:hypothetical protein